MPFIDAPSRVRLLDPKEGPKTPGELCYVFYKNIVRMWGAEKRWTTVHNILKFITQWNDEKTAHVLAFAVFFIWVVVPYEKQKELENGTIE